jgi:hypothetical protein
MSWWRRRKRVTPTAAGNGEPSGSLPFEVELIPSQDPDRPGLKARVEVHDEASTSGPLRCRSYFSEGLSVFGQKELVLTLLQEGKLPRQKRDPALQFIAALYGLAEQGTTVDVGNFTQFAVGPWGPFAAVAYTEPEPSAARTAPPRLLRGILLTEAEIDVAQAFGLSRVLGRLGRAYRRYPYPPWVDATRPSVASHDEMEETILHGIQALPIGGARSLWLRDQDLIVLRLTFAAGELLAHALTQLPAAAPVAVLTEVDPTASGCLVWEPGQRGPAVIAVNEGVNGSVFSGCFMLFIPDQPANSGRGIEDGLCFELTASSWTALREALATRRPATIQADDAGFSFSLEWAPDSPETLGTSDDEAATIDHVKLLTPEDELAARVPVEALSGYVRQVDATVNAHFGSREEPSSGALVAHFELDVDDRHLIRLVSADPSNDWHLDRLHDALLRVDRPEIAGGPVTFEIEFDVAGRSG